MEKEVKAADAVLGNIKRPFTAIMGGSKVSTKIGIIENLLTKVDNLILCGGMTYTFSKALGGKIGMSICEDDKLDVALDVIKKAKENGVNLVLGTDSICGDDFKNDCNTQVCPSNNIPDGWEGMDAGPETRKASQLPSRVPRLSSGTVLQVYSSSTTSLVVLRLLLTQSLRLLRKVHSHSSVVVTL